MFLRPRLPARMLRSMRHGPVAAARVTGDEAMRGSDRSARHFRALTTSASRPPPSALEPRRAAGHRSRRDAPYPLRSQQPRHRPQAESQGLSGTLSPLSYGGPLPGREIVACSSEEARGDRVRFCQCSRWGICRLLKKIAGSQEERRSPFELLLSLTWRFTFKFETSGPSAA